MESYTFTANHADDNFWIGLGIALALLAAAALWALARKGANTPSLDRNRRMLLAMLCYFVVLMGVGVAGFSGWNRSRTPSVSIDADALRWGSEVIPIGDIRQAAIENNQQNSFVNPDIAVSSSRMLVIERKDGRRYVFAEGVYDIAGILNALREMGQ
jgi:hypothetical protein